jgi:putative transposase
MGMAFAGGSEPEIFHSDQGTQFTSIEFVERLQAEKIKISCSGRRRWIHKILVRGPICTIRDTYLRQRILFLALII